MSRHEKLRGQLDRLEARRDDLLSDLVDVEVRARKIRASLRRSLSAQARGVRPPSPRAREDRAQDAGERAARRAARLSPDELKEHDRASKAAALERARATAGVKPRARRAA